MSNNTQKHPFYSHSPLFNEFKAFHTILQLKNSEKSNSQINTSFLLTTNVGWSWLEL